MFCEFCDVEKTPPVLRPGRMHTPVMCDNCWEVWARIRRIPIKVLNKIVISARSREYYVPRGERR